MGQGRSLRVLVALLVVLCFCVSKPHSGCLHTETRGRLATVETDWTGMAQNPQFFFFFFGGVGGWGGEGGSRPFFYFYFYEIKIKIT